MPQTSDVIVITSCTSRKRASAQALALEGTKAVQSVGELARNWKHQVQAASESDLLAAIDLYGGRSITEAKRAAEALSAPLYIISAGQGMLRGDERIPSYDITVASSQNNDLHQFLARLGKTTADWWQALVEAFGQQRSFAYLVTSSQNAVVLLAVPSAYLTLLARDLASLTGAELQRLRIITSPFGASQIPSGLRAVVLPYDERLEGLAAFAGTRNDFPQRALRHFVTLLKGHELPLDVAAERVREAMNVLVKPSLPQRQRKTDDEIKGLLIQNWRRYNGSASALLRFLRDEALVACEQSRFALLRRQVLFEINANVSHDG